MITELHPALQNIMETVNTKIEHYFVDADDDNELRLQKKILVMVIILTGIAGIIWGTIYLIFDEPLAGVDPFIYAIISGINLTYFAVKKSYNVARFIQLLSLIILPFLLMWTLGGFVPGSVVCIWAFVSALSALLLTELRQAILWFGFYLVLLAVSAAINPSLRQSNNLPEWLTSLFFVFNIFAVSVVTYIVTVYFVGNRRLSIQLLQENLELERAYTQQEVILRQNEKLATLGKVSAGLAHEINNPAAAAQRGLGQLKTATDQLQVAYLSLERHEFTPAQINILDNMKERVQSALQHHVNMNSLERSDREFAIENWLIDHRIQNGWELAPALVSLGYEEASLTRLAEIFNPEQRYDVITLICKLYDVYSLFPEVVEATRRITDIVQAMKDYTFMDQAPVQMIDIHQGLESTLVIMRNKLKDGVTVHREFARDLPPIEAYGSELNQVWTNLIDNAVDAMNGQGEITLRTYLHDGCIFVEVEDNGPGIPVEIQSTLFDPFVTTKAPGKGTGMGLNISHHIVVQKHQGTLSATSSPGKTTFTVRLPLHLHKENGNTDNQTITTTINERE